MEENKNKKPVIIVGCPRTGTLLTARIIGGHYSHFLITEHAKKQCIPEDKSGLNDSEVWWDFFSFSYWDKRKNRPAVEEPDCNEENIKSLRKYYFKLANGKRIIIKNPNHLLRVDFLKEIFPDAFFVFVVRNPWHTLQSIIAKRSSAFILRTRENFSVPYDLLLRAAYSWKYANEVFLEKKDNNWLTVKYEDLVSSPRETVDRIFSFINLDDKKYFEQAVLLPKVITRNYYLVKKSFVDSSFKKEIMAAIKSGCEFFNYSSNPRDLPGRVLGYWWRFLKDGREKRRLKRRLKKNIYKIYKKFIFYGG